MTRKSIYCLMAVLMALSLTVYGCGGGGGGGGNSFTAADRDGNLWSLNTNGTGTPMLDVYNSVTGVDIGPISSMVYDATTGYIYAGMGGQANCSGCMYKIDPKTGEAYEVLDEGWNAIPGMSMYNGEIYMFMEGDDDLYKVTPTAGTAVLATPTLVGTLDSISGWGNGMTFLSDGSLFVTSEYLNEIDPTDGTLTSEKYLTFNSLDEFIAADPDFWDAIDNELRVQSMVTKGNTVYGLLKDHYDEQVIHIVTVDTETSTVDYVSTQNHPLRLDGLVTAPVKSNFAINAPDAPTGESALDGFEASLIGWDPVFGADSYTVYWSETASIDITDPLTYDGTATASDTMYSHAGTVATTYYYVVTAKRKGLESDASAEVSAAPANMGAEVIKYAPDNTVLTNPLVLDDDELSAALDIGFTFTFFGTDFTQLKVSSNGWLTFDTAYTGSDNSGYLGDLNYAEDMIAFAWSDIAPPLSMGEITYDTIGTTPNRKFILSFTDISRYYENYYYGGENDITTQVILYETTNLVEIHTTNMDFNGYDVAQGVENSDASISYYLPGRNTEDFELIKDAVRFHTN